MIKAKSSIVINKPAAEIFAFVTNAETAPQWQGGVEAVILDGPPNVVGSKYTEVRKFMGQEMKSVLEIIAFETDVKWAAKVLEGPVPYTVTVTFTPEGAGIKMDTTVEGEPKGFFKIAGGMLESQLTKSLQEDAESLKKLLEGG